MAAQTGWQLRQRTPSPDTDDPSNSRPKTRPRPDASRPRGGLGGTGSGTNGTSSSSSTTTTTATTSASTSSSTPSSKSASFSGLGALRTPSRTQLRHAKAARRLSGDGIVVSYGECSDDGRDRGDANGRVIDAPEKDKISSPEGDSRTEGLQPQSPQAGPSSSSSSSQTTPTPRRNNLSRTNSNSDVTTATSSVRLHAPRPQRPVGKPKRSPGSVTASEIIFALATGTEASLSSATRPSPAEQEYYRSLVQKADARRTNQRNGGITANGNGNERQVPLLPKTLEAVGVDLIVDSTNLKTLSLAQPILKATYMTPCTMLDMLHHNDNFCHLWLTVEETLQRLPPEMNVSNQEHLEFAVRNALPKLIAEISYAVNDCGTHNEGPHYAFLDPRILDAPSMNEAIAYALEQADTIAHVLTGKGLRREQIIFSIPATECGLRIAHALKQQLSLQSNLVFVSNLVQARACASIGAASVTLPVANLVQHEEFVNPFCHSKDSAVAFESVQAIACYMKKHALPTKVIGMGLRNLSDIKYLSCLDAVVIREREVERAKWMPLRVNKPPQEGSPAMVRAANVQAPLSLSPTQAESPSSTTSLSTENGTANGAKKTDPEEPFNFLSKLSYMSRQETTTLLREVLSVWKVSINTIEDALRAEFERRVFTFRSRRWQTNYGSDGSLERTDTEPLEEEYDGEEIGRYFGEGSIGTPRSSNAREEKLGGALISGGKDVSFGASKPRGRAKERAKTPSNAKLDWERGGSQSRMMRSLRRTASIIRGDADAVVPFPVVGKNGADDPMEGQRPTAPPPTDEMLLQSPMVRQRHSFDSDSDSDSEDEFLYM